MITVEKLLEAEPNHPTQYTTNKFQEIESALMLHRLSLEKSSTKAKHWMNHTPQEVEPVLKITIPNLNYIIDDLPDHQYGHSCSIRRVE